MMQQNIAYAGSNGENTSSVEPDYELIELTQPQEGTSVSVLSRDMMQQNIAHAGFNSENPSSVEPDYEDYELFEPTQPQEGTSLPVRKGPMNSGSLQKLWGFTCVTMTVVTIIVTAVLLTLSVTVTVVLLRSSIQTLNTKVNHSNQDIDIATIKQELMSLNESFQNGKRH